MDQFRVRDRDAPISPEGIIFRTYAYTHPPDSAICDVEYAHSGIYHSDDKRAPRITKNNETYYKFYADNGLNFVKNKYPQYLIYSESLNTSLVGIKKEQMKELRRPDEKIANIFSTDPPDNLIATLFDLFELIKDHSNLRLNDFGIFGSILHDFYDVNLADLDLIIYGYKNLCKLREMLADFYTDANFPVKNEFDSQLTQATPKHWYFKNYTVQDYLHYQREKLIYAVMKTKRLKRSVKIEFEPVKNWNEITQKYDPHTKIKRVGWIRATGTILDGRDSYYLGAIYPIEIDKIITGQKVDEIRQIVSFIEEFRGQLTSDDTFLVEGNLEKVSAPNDEYYQITLTYGPNYHHQVLKKLEKK